MSSSIATKKDYRLTQAQVDSFHRNGWLGPLDTFSEEEVALVKKDLESISKIELLGDQKVRTFENSFLGMKTTLNLHFDIQSLSKLYEDERIVGRLNQLGEDDLLFWRTAVWHRMPGQQGVGWHQTYNNYGYGALDDAESELIFPKDEDPLNLSVWVALADIDPGTGVLNFANGTHRCEKFATTSARPGQDAYPQGLVYKPEKHDNVVTPGEAFDEADWDVQKVQSIKAGQMIIFTERVMHMGPSNNSETQERWGCNARYVSPSVQVHPQRFMDEYEYEYGWDLQKHYSILVSGEDKYGINEVLPEESRAESA